MEKLISQTLKENIIFYNDLKVDDQERLTQSVIIKNYKKNQLVTAHSFEYACMYIVLKGSVRASVDGESGKTVTLKRYNKRDNVIVSLGKNYLGFEIAINFYVDEDCEIAVLSSFLVNILFNSYISVRDFVIKNAIALLSGAVDLLQLTTNRDIRCKVAIWLTDRLLKIEKGSKITITHEEIAQEIGSVREVVSRNLKKLQQQGIVKLNRGSIEVLSREKLEEISDV